MTKRQLEIIQHAVGADQYGRRERYNDRNFYCGHDPDCDALVVLRYMRILPNTALCEDVHYAVTDAGREAMRVESPAPPKLTPGKKRYREWLNCADCFPDWEFGDWLKHRKELLREHSALL